MAIAIQAQNVKNSCVHVPVSCEVDSKNISHVHVCTYRVTPEHGTIIIILALCYVVRIFDFCRNLENILFTHFDLLSSVQ